ncbi:MAG TPA: hypothetical protein VJ873_02320, partial [bacterium]|nr:hypothetical protein [bacterium]
MPINRRLWLQAVPFTVALLAVFSLRAATIEVENDDEDIEAAPTATAQPSKPLPSKPAPATQTAPTPMPTTQPKANNIPLTTKRVRVSDNVGFYYFVKAGYVTDPDQVPAIGEVVGSMDHNTSYSFPKRTFIETTSDKAKLMPGDLLVVYRAVQPIEEAHAGSLGFQVENEAIVRVVETQEHRYWVETVKSFRPFQAGDKVVAYETEIQRWKSAQIKKPLPAQTVTCFVAGGPEDGVQKSYNQADFIYLSAGTKQGLVEGQTFRL